MSDISLSKAVRSNLLSLQSTATMMSKTQERLATGNKVNSALDNPSNFFTATSLNSRAADMSNLLDSMASGIKVIEAANNGLTALTKNLESMQSTLRQARQDKSFQTKSFDVTADSVINLSGGQFGNMSAEVSLASATVPGEKATVGTTGTEAYLGPQTAVGESGAGARSVIDLGTGFTNGDTFTVAGQDVAVTADVSAQGIADSISAALEGADETAGKYTVSVGTGDNAGKVVIESIDTSAAAAAVDFDPDGDAATGVNTAVRATTSFNYSAITSSIQAGGQTIATGSDFTGFVANLQAGAEDGGYTVTADATTKQITLTSKAVDGAAPSVTGVADSAGVVAGSKAETAFQLTNYDDGGTNKLTSDQTLSVAGATGDIELTADMTAANVKTAIEADANINAAYDVAVDADFNVTLTAKANSAAAAPAVTSSKGTAATATTSSVVAGGGVDFTDDAAVQGLAGSTITSSDGAQAYTFTAGDSAADQLQALTDKGFTVSANAGGGLDISRADGKNFTVVDNSGGAFGTPTTTYTTTNGVEAGLVGGNAAVTTEAGVADTAAVNGKTSTTATAGASVATVAAQKNEFSVSYDGKTANISIGAVKGGSGPDAIEPNALDINKWQSATIASVNSQLEAAGIQGVEASFDDAGKFSLVAKAAEAKTLAVSGDDSVALFGTDGVDTGVAEKSELNATKTVDKFVELINRDHGTSVRASNDNGKLRIENLSTQALDMGVDTNGNDVVTAMKIDGNNVRDNLHKQFNELRDQMDKLSDDASFNGINLLRGDKLTITFNENGSSSINIQAKDKTDSARSINASSLGIDSLVAIDLDSDAGIDAFLGKISSALSDIRSQASTFGSNLSSVENRQTFTKSMINTLETGAANLTLADMNEEAANLLALQTRQSLSSSTLSMASQADQSILQLLR